MRKFFVSFLLIAGVISVTGAAPREAVRGSTSGQTSVRSATQPVSSRSAVSQKTSSSVVGRAAVAPTQKVAARAATTTQKVINSGTKITSATPNTIVNEACQNKYFGCMDAFCMLDNASGGRCLCSDRNAELDLVLEEIEKLDQQTYEMATLGVEQIEMGENADAAIAKANAVADSAVRGNAKKTTRAALDLSAWNMSVDFDDDDIFADTNTLQMSMDGKTGDALNRAADELCVAQIPECANDMAMLQLLYAQRIKSDCTAYENSLKQRKNASQTKLSTAQKALREAALEQLQIANKYDLGQCTIQFKKCMQTTAECGDDFAKCASIAATDSVSVNKSTMKQVGNYSIKGDVTTIEISASTYDTLLAKKPLCEGITKSCTSVADKVWDTFLREVAPALKSAEIIAENDIRQNCIGNIAKCFRNACRDNIDPNNPEGSYDMCLTRPETMLSACKIPLNSCGIDASSIANAQKSQIWGFVEARLASMRVDSCTKEVKSCLQSPDRCGSDYTQCVGLDTKTIVAMCPPEKLVGCQERTDDGIRKNSLQDISNLVIGIFLNIDNTMLDQCQNAVTTKMLEICGDTATCAAFDNDDVMGTDSLMSYKNVDGDYVIDGLISFGNLEINEVDEASNSGDVKFGKYQADISQYANNLNENTSKQRIIASLRSVGNKIKEKVTLLSEDPQIKMCVEGRDLSQIRNRTDGDHEDWTDARYPSLTDSSILTIIRAGFGKAEKNYNAKYNEMLGKAIESQDDDVKSVLCAAMVTKDADRVCKEKGLFGLCRKYGTVFDDFVVSDGDTSNGTYVTQHIISGIKLSDLLNVQRNGYREYYMADENNVEVQHIVMSSSYSSVNKSCTVTTEKKECKNISSNIEDMDLYEVLATDKGKLKRCSSYDEPIVSSKTIEM